MRELHEIEFVEPRGVALAQNVRQRLAVVVGRRRAQLRARRRPGNFVCYHALGNASALGQGRHPHDHRVQVAEVPRPAVGRGEREIHEALARLLAEGDVLAGLFREARQLVDQVRFDVLASFGESGQVEAPEVDARQKVRPEAPAGDIHRQIAVCAADQLEVAVLVFHRAQRTEGLLLDGLEQHRLRLKRQLADFVQEHDAAVGLLEKAVMVRARAGIRAFLVPEERRFREIAAERRAIDGHERALDLAGLLLEKIDLPGQLALARAGGAGQQDGVRGADGDALDRLDELVERLVLRVDSLLEEREVVLPLQLEALGELVVAGEVEIDDVDRTLGVARMADMALLGRRLHELRVQVSRLREKEKADLLHMRASGHVDVVFGLLLVETGLLRVVVELAVDFFEVPRILELDDVEDDFRLGRDALDVGLDPLREGHELLVEDKMQLVDRQTLLLDEADGRSPRVPARRAGAAMRVLLRPENRYRCDFHGAYCIMFRRVGLYDKIEIIKLDYAIGMESTQKGA